MVHCVDWDFFIVASRNHIYSPELDSERDFENLQGHTSSSQSEEEHERELFSKQCCITLQ